MNMIKKGVLLFLALVLLSVSVSAANFDVEFEKIDGTITFGQLAEFRLTIKNNMASTQEFKVRSLNYPEWDLSTDPLVNPIQFSITPDGEKGVSLFLNPLHIPNYGVYDVTIIVELVSRKEQIKTPLRVNIVSPQAGSYVETVLATIIMDDEIDPTKEIPIKISLNNQNIIEYPDLSVTVESKLINEVIKVSLGKKEKKTVSFTESIDPKTPQQGDTLVVKVVSSNKTLDTKVKQIEIIGKKELAKDEKTKSRFLKVVDEITLTNIGNVAYNEGIKIESSFIQNLFTSSTPKGKFIKEDGIRYLVVPVDIEPGDSATIKVTKNYITLLLIFVLLTFIVLFYFVLRSPLTVKKTASNIALKEGGVSELKVILNVSNRSNNKINDIEIIDKIPNIADLEKGLTIGTLQPSKILRHEKKGTMIKWVIEELHAGDERVITYKVKSHLSIVGEFSLAQAVAKCRYKGKTVISHSNSLGINP